MLVEDDELRAEPSTSLVNELYALVDVGEASTVPIGLVIVWGPLSTPGSGWIELLLFALVVAGVETLRPHVARDGRDPHVRPDADMTMAVLSA